MIAKVWYVLEASMLTGESTVCLFSKEDDAKIHYEKQVAILKNQIMKSFSVSSWEEVRKEDIECDYVKEYFDSFWVNGDILSNGTQADQYIEIGFQNLIFS